MASARRLACGLVWAALAAACQNASVRPPAMPGTPAGTGLLAYPGGEAQPLTVSTTDLSTDGRTARVRGRTINPYDEPVEGIRYVFVMVATGNPPRVLDHFEKESDARIAPGGSTALSWDIQSMYFGSVGRFLLLAFPKKIGNREVPPPSTAGLTE